MTGPTARWLSRPVNPAADHVLGPEHAEITLVEYGSYDSPQCRRVTDSITVRDQLGHRLRYVFRHRPTPRSDLARRAAELAERAGEVGRFWHAHMILMKRSETLVEDDLRVVHDELDLGRQEPAEVDQAARRARERVADECPRERREDHVDLLHQRAPL
ncbi:DsbA family protein [Geminicoccus harenae]|uniref:DsbA family protein n=1 Tax=Geminicoccus harenae TaxID=2498453 RepID=UPI001C948077|nr:thioredoxin domain-containing protein [Geminicoccus harenae]